ncbi:MAG: hypothetical protein IJ667_04605 [Synergistaceae bacterium]|nr:hypothetical protein [Synergistaceae bacterium]
MKRLIFIASMGICLRPAVRRFTPPARPQGVFNLQLLASRREYRNS